MSIEPPKRLILSDADSKTTKETIIPSPKTQNLSAPEETVVEDQTVEILFGTVQIEDTPKINIFNSMRIAKQLAVEKKGLAETLNTYRLYTIHELEVREKELDGIVAGYNKVIDTQESKLTDLRDNIEYYTQKQELQNDGYYDYDHPAEEAIKLKLEIDNIKAKSKSLIRDKRAATVSENFRFNQSAAKGKKFMNDMRRLLLRAYNAEAENAIKSATTQARTQTAKRRLDKCRNDIHKLGQMIDLEIREEYHKLRMQEIDVSYRYYLMKEAEKETAREQRAALAEERKAQQELNRRKENLEKELNQKLIAYSNWEKTYNPEQRTLTTEQEEEKELFLSSIQEVRESIETVNHRNANLKAGYVYVISNIGSFGESIVKIGMTRRIDPTERVKELSSASVPFIYNTHLIHYSEDARGIEAKLHQHFAKRRVNLANPRKEFFYAQPEEVKEAMLTLDGTMTTFIETPIAEDYENSNTIRTQII